VKPKIRVLVKWQLHAMNVVIKFDMEHALTHEKLRGAELTPFDQKRRFSIDIRSLCLSRNT